MIGDPSTEEHEPDEFDPLEDIGPDVPEVDVPEVSTPTPEPSDTDVPTDLKTTFWKLVGLIKIGLISISLGPMFVFFRGEWVTGGSLVGLGVVTFAYAYLEYRRYRDRDD